MLDCSVDGDPEKNFEILLSTLKSVRDETLSSRKIRLDKRKHPVNPWMTKAILVSINRRNAMYKTLKTHLGSYERFCTLERQLEKYQKILRALIKQAKKNYNSRQIAENKNDPRKLWKVLNSIISPTSDEKNRLPEYFIIDGNTVENDQEIANAFNLFFTNIASTIVSDLGPPPENFCSYLGIPPNLQFHFGAVNTTDVEKAINSLTSKKTKDCDGFSTELIKSIKNQLLEPLTVIINQIIHKNVFLRNLKIARVVAIHKKDDKHSLDNYRPISILPVLSKIVERLLHDQLTQYLYDNNIIFSSQYGFRSGHSTELAAAELVDKIMFNLDTHKSYLSCYMDLSKAFDCLDHEILLAKLSH